MALNLHIMIETKRLKIIPLEEKHLENLRQMRNDPTTNHWLTDIMPISEEAQKEWFKKLQLDKSRTYLAIESNIKSTTIYGYTYSSSFIGILRSDKWDRVNRSVRIGIDIAKEHRGQGYGTEAFGAFIDYLFKQQNMNRLWFLVAEENKIAQKLYKKLGFKEEGKQREALFRDGKYHDYLMFSLLEGEWSFGKLRIKSSFAKGFGRAKKNE